MAETDGKAPHVSITVDASSEETAGKGIKQILQVIKPTWDTGDVTIQKMPGGFVNNMFKAGNSAGEMVVFRIYTPLSYIAMNPENLHRYMVAAYHAGVGAKVLGSFDNGLAYAYQAGQALHPDKEEHQTVEFRKRIVRMLVKFNRVDLSIAEPDTLPRILEDALKNKTTLPDDLSLNLEGFSDLASSKSLLVAELDWLVDEIHQLEYQVAFTHGDIWYANILHDEEKDTLGLIDFDLCGPNLLPCDIAVFMGMALVRTDPWSMDQLPESEQKIYCRTYIEEWRRLDGRKDQGVDDTDADILHALTKPIFLLTVLHNIAVTISSLKDGAMDAAIFLPILKLYDELYETFKEQYLQLKAKQPRLFVKCWQP